MHYIGMAALPESAHLTYAASYVAASIVIAIAASGLALWLAGGRGRRPPLLASASALGIAIAGMHYTAMAGLTLKPHPVSLSGAPALSTDGYDTGAPERLAAEMAQLRRRCRRIICLNPLLGWEG